MKKFKILNYKKSNFVAQENKQYFNDTVEALDDFQESSKILNKQFCDKISILSVYKLKIAMLLN